MSYPQPLKYLKDLRPIRSGVPGTYSEFEQAVKKWISICVMSRTKVGGKPITREEVLVSGNTTLREVWTGLGIL